MKKNIKYLLFLIILIVCAFLDSCIFTSFRLSLLLCVCFSFYNHDTKAVVISSMCGLLCDVISLTLPYFSLLYLYISLGCVWCEGIFLSLKLRTVFMLSFIAFFVFYLSTYAINMIQWESFFISFDFVLSSVVFSLANSTLAPVIYFGFKRFGF